MRNKIHLLKYVDRYGWAHCVGSGWYKNNRTVDTFILEWDYGRGGPPCGVGYYGTHGHANVKYNGDWKGGPMWSGVAHYLPTGSLVASEGEPPAGPEWMREDGSIIVPSFPDELATLDANGDFQGSLSLDEYLDYDGPEALVMSRTVSADGSTETVRLR